MKLIIEYLNTLNKKKDIESILNNKDFNQSDFFSFLFDFSIGLFSLIILICFLFNYLFLESFLYEMHLMDSVFANELTFVSEEIQHMKTYKESASSFLVINVFCFFNGLLSILKNIFFKIKYNWKKPLYLNEMDFLFILNLLTFSYSFFFLLKFNSSSLQDYSFFYGIINSGFFSAFLIIFYVLFIIISISNDCSRQFYLKKIFEKKSYIKKDIKAESLNLQILNKKIDAFEIEILKSKEALLFLHETNEKNKNSRIYKDANILIDKSLKGFNTKASLIEISFEKKQANENMIVNE